MTSHHMLNPIQQFQTQFPQSQHLTQHSTRIRSSTRCLATWLKYFFIKVKLYLHQYSKAIYTLLIIFQMVYIYFQSYEYDEGLKCPYKLEADCMNNFYPLIRDEASNWVFKILIDGFIVLFFVHSLLLNKTFRFLSILGLFQIYWLYIHGPFEMGSFDMGGIFKMVHISMFIFILVLYAMIMLCYTYCKFKWKIFFVSLIIAIAIMIVVFFVARQKSCYFWKFGINGEIYNSAQLCRPIQPSCWVMYLEDLFDLSPILYKTSLGEQYRLIVDQYIPYPEKGSIIGFGNSNLLADIQRNTDDFQQSVLKLTNRYKTLKEALNSTNKQDVYLDNKEQKYHIKVRRNQTLVKERKQKLQKVQKSSSPPLAKNILFLFFDSMSRAETHYKMPQTMNWFKKSSKYESYKDHEPLKVDPNTSESFEFYRSNSVGYLTFQNNMAMFYGLPYKFTDNITIDSYIKQQSEIVRLDRLPKQHPQDVIFFGRDYQNKGFITSSSSTSCNIMNADHFQEDLKSFNPPRYDHQAYSFPCDPNFQQYESPYSAFSGSSSATDRNLYGKKMSEYTFQYTLSFFEAYKDMPKLQVLNFMEGHDYYLGSSKHVDQPFRKFLDTFQQRGYSNDTVIILASDHGQHSIDIKKLYIVEHYHNLLVMSLPKDINAKYRDAIRRNQQNLVTPFNIYHTMEHLLNGEDYDLKNMSLLSNLSFQKTCIDAKIPIEPKQICACDM